MISNLPPWHIPNEFARKWEQRQQRARRIRNLSVALIGVGLVGFALTMLTMWNTANAEVITYARVEQVSKPNKFSATVTAYTSSVEETDSTPFEMASGKHVYAGAIACPGKYAFGTKVVIAGKTYTCEDRMALRYRHGNYFDIWKSDLTDALRFGRQTIDVQILK